MPQPKKGAKPAAKILSVADVEQADDIGTETVEIPEWGGAVKVRGLGHGEVVDVFRDLDLDVDDEGNLHVPASRAGEYQIALIVRGAVEPELTPEVLNTKAAQAISRLADAISGLSGLGPGSTPNGASAAGAVAEKGFS